MDRPIFIVQKAFNNKKTLLSLLLFFLILISGLIYTSKIETFVDLSMYDEIYYFFQAKELSLSTPLNANWGPFYLLWIKSLLAFSNSPVEAFYLNVTLLCLILALSSFLFLITIKVNPFLAFIIAYFILLSQNNLFTFPKSTFLCLSVIILGLIPVFNTENLCKKLFYSSFLMLITSYIRPEFFISFILVFIVFHALLYIKKEKFKLEYASIYLTILVLYLKCNFPIFTPGDSTNRSFLAFSQHFSINYYHWFNIQKDPFLFGIGAYLPDVHSISDMLLKHPVLFFRHILENGKELVIMTRYIFYHPNLVFRFTDQGLYEAILLAMALVFYFLWKRNTIKLNYGSLTIVAIILFPSTISALLIFPRFHYIVILLIVLILVAFTVFKDSNNSLNFNKITWGMILLITLISFFTPNGSKASYSNQKDLRLVRLMDLKIKENSAVLESGAGFCYCLNKKFNIKHLNATANWLEEYHLGKLDAIVIDYNFVAFIGFESAPFKSLMLEYKKYGYKKYEIQGTQNALLVKE